MRALYINHLIVINPVYPAHWVIMKMLQFKVVLKVSVRVSLSPPRSLFSFHANSLALHRPPAASPSLFAFWMALSRRSPLPNMLAAAATDRYRK